MLIKHWRAVTALIVFCGLAAILGSIFVNQSARRAVTLLYPTGEPSGYKADDRHVYYESSLIPAADVVSFKPLAMFQQEGGVDEFARDADHVFFFSFIIPGADPDTFEVLDRLRSCGSACVYEARDKHNLYYQNQIFNRPR